jgi:hypothetical protein
MDRVCYTVDQVGALCSMLIDDSSQLSFSPFIPLMVWALIRVGFALHIGAKSLHFFIQERFF